MKISSGREVSQRDVDFVRELNKLKPNPAGIKRAAALLKKYDVGAKFIAWRQVRAAAMARVGRLEERRRLAHGPAGKLQRAHERAKRLRTRIRRLSTALRKVERQARALKRRLVPAETAAVGG
jgi:hypothetical protein